MSNISTYTYALVYNKHQAVGLCDFAGLELLGRWTTVSNRSYNKTHYCLKKRYKVV